jgi:dihydropyrimidinase
MLRDARLKGEEVFAETCPHYLALSEDVYKRPDGAHFICSPPLRSQADIDALWKGVADGTLSAIGSDHCGFGKDQKATGKGDFSRTPNGLPGIETRLPVIYTRGVAEGRIDVSRMVDVLSTGPAKIFGLYPQKGAIQPGSDGDLVVFDPREEWVISPDSLNSPVDWTPYEGMKVRGKVHTTIAGGRIVCQEGRFLGRKGDGRFLKRKL